MTSVGAMPLRNPRHGEEARSAVSNHATTVLHLPAFEHRLALLRPGLERLGVILGCGAGGARGGERIAVEPAGRDAVDRPFEAGQGQRRVGGQCGGERIDPRRQFLRRHDLVEIADAAHLLGLDRLGRHEKLLRRAGAEPRYVALDTTRVVDDPEPRRRHQHPHALDADAEVAGQREVGGTAVDAALQRRDSRHAQRLEAVDDSFERVVGLAGFGLAGMSLQERPDMIARRKALPGPREDQHAHARVIVDPGKGVAQDGEIARFEAVVLARSVEPDGRAAFRDRHHRRVRRTHLLGHARFLLAFLTAATVADAFPHGQPAGTLGRPSRCQKMRLLLFAAILSLATLPAAAQQVQSGEPAARGPTPGSGGAGQVGSGVVNLPDVSQTPVPAQNPNAAPGSTTLTSTNPTGGTSSGGAVGGAASAGTVSGPGAITTGTTAVASVPHSSSGSTQGIGAVVNTGTGSVPSSNGTSSTTAESGGARSSASGGRTTTSGASTAAGSNGNSAASTGSRGTSGASTNNATAAASSGHSAPTFLCLSGASSDAAPFLTGTSLSCAP